MPWAIHRGMIRFGIRYFFAAAVLGTAFGCFGDDLRYWTSFNTQGVSLDEHWKTASHLQMRSPGLEFLQYGRFSQKFLRTVSDEWTLGAHPAIEFKRGSGGDSWANDYRIEIEATGKFDFGKGAALSTRSRWEFRLKDGRGGEVFHRVRQQVKATWKLEGWRSLDSYTLGNEMFYELDRGQIVTNRFFPLSVGFASSGKVKTGAWLMYFSQRSNATGAWTGSYVLGADFKF